LKYDLCEADGKVLKAQESSRYFWKSGKRLITRGRARVFGQAKSESSIRTDKSPTQSHFPKRIDRSEPF
jgi:hypothetical protein